MAQQHMTTLQDGGKFLCKALIDSGTRYSKLNIARITAVHGLQAGLCNQCLEMMNANGGPSVYVLAVDQKGDPGLDVAISSFSAAFPGANPLDPQTCKWRVVDPSKCGKICYGSKEECTPGVRNSLPAYLLPPLPDAPNGINIGLGTGGSGGEPYNTPSMLPSTPSSAYTTFKSTPYTRPPQSTSSTYSTSSQLPVYDKASTYLPGSLTSVTVYITSTVKAPITPPSTPSPTTHTSRPTKKCPHVVYTTQGYSTTTLPKSSVNDSNTGYYGIVSHGNQNRISVLSLAMIGLGLLIV
ncbi:hypothetical protein HDV02_003197 [Globomyces sp. JEL0801]|nr:hypothetical protein HDV02_003197 [Globomyces sp. JEL0801]